MMEFSGEFDRRQPEANLPSAEFLYQRTTAIPQNSMESSFLRIRPLFDVRLHDLMDYDQIRRYMDNDLIEIAPLAYMRGRTFERRGDHPGRGPERDGSADEDVLDSDGSERTDRGDR